MRRTNLGENIRTCIILIHEVGDIEIISDHDYNFLLYILFIVFHSTELSVYTSPTST